MVMLTYVDRFVKNDVLKIVIVYNYRLIKILNSRRLFESVRYYDNVIPTGRICAVKSFVTIKKRV